MILDGHHRAWITADLGIDCPRRTVAGLSEEQKRTHAVAVNVHRRSLTREQRNEVILKLRNDGMTQAKIAEATGVPQQTVSRVLNTQVGNDRAPQTIVNARGQERPATYDRHPAPAPKPEPPSDADLFAGEDWVQPAGPGFQASDTPPHRRNLPQDGREGRSERLPGHRPTEGHRRPSKVHEVACGALPKGRGVGETSYGGQQVTCRS